MEALIAIISFIFFAVIFTQWLKMKDDLQALKEDQKYFEENLEKSILGIEDAIEKTCVHIAWSATALDNTTYAEDLAESTMSDAMLLRSVLSYWREHSFKNMKQNGNKTENYTDLENFDLMKGYSSDIDRENLRSLFPSEEIWRNLSKKKI